MDTMRADERDGFTKTKADFVRGEPESLITDLIKLGVILNWPERIKTQPHDDRDNCFLPFHSKGPCGMTVKIDIDDDSATKHSDSHTRNSHRQSI